MLLLPGPCAAAPVLEEDLPVIATLDRDGVPRSVGEIREGDELLLRIVKARIPLSASVVDPSVYPVVGAALGLNLTNYDLRVGV